MEYTQLNLISNAASFTKTSTIFQLGIDFYPNWCYYETLTFLWPEIDVALRRGLKFLQIFPSCLENCTFLKSETHYNHLRVIRRKNNRYLFDAQQWMDGRDTKWYTLFYVSKRKKVTYNAQLFGLNTIY